MDELLQSYEEVPYPSDPVYQTHPDALATPAFLAGLNPTPVDKSRVLEIGCGTAGNLIALAVALPESHFIGVDLSPRQIADGQEWIDELGLKNVELRAVDILDLGAELGQLDYVLCHGVYSWCPPSVQERILTLCQERLAPNGVAYISFNVLPGWHRMGVMRYLMRWGGRVGADFRTRVRDGKRFLEIVAQAAATLDPQYSQLVRNGEEKLRTLPDAYLVHEHLEAFNEPLHFHEMASRVGEKGLQYLGESCRQTDLGELSPPLREWLDRSAANRVEREQYLDFLRNASFRRSLFCRAGLTLEEPTIERLAKLHMNALCEPVSKQPDVISDKEEAFEAEKGKLTTDIPLVKATLVALSRVWPRTLTLAGLCADVRVRLNAVDDPELTDEVIADGVLQCYGANLVALHLWVPHFSSSPGERPLAGPLPRMQAKLGVREVTNLRHRPVPLNAYELALLPKLDGTRDHAALVDEMVREAVAGAFMIEKDRKEVRGAEAVRPLVVDALGPTLQRLAHAALMIS